MCKKREAQRMPLPVLLLQMFYTVVGLLALVRGSLPILPCLTPAMQAGEPLIQYSALAFLQLLKQAPNAWPAASDTAPVAAMLPGHPRTA